MSLKLNPTKLQYVIDKLKNINTAIAVSKE